MKYPPRDLYVIRGTSDGGFGQGATSSPESGNAQPPLPVRAYRDEEPDWSALVAAVSFLLAFVLVLTVAVASR